MLHSFQITGVLRSVTFPPKRESAEGQSALVLIAYGQERGPSLEGNLTPFVNEVVVRIPYRTLSGMQRSGIRLECLAEGTPLAVVGAVQGLRRVKHDGSPANGVELIGHSVSVGA